MFVSIWSDPTAETAVHLLPIKKAHNMFHNETTSGTLQIVHICVDSGEILAHTIPPPCQRLSAFSCPLPTIATDFPGPPPLPNTQCTHCTEL